MTADGRDPAARTRSTDRGWRIVLRENWYRDVWLLAISGLWLWGAVTLSGQNGRIETGRHYAVGVTCAVESAVAQAGRAVILGSANSASGRFGRELEKLGYPPVRVRRRMAEQAAALYVRHIATRVEAQVGGSASSRLIRPDGTLDCRALERLSGASSGP